MSLYHTANALDERTAERLTSMLGAGERFVLAVTVPDGLYKRRRSRLILTDARLLRVRHGYGILVETESYDLRELSGVSLSGDGRAELRIETADETLSYPLEPDDGTEFAGALERELVQRTGGH